jgi:hypothetical protein
MNSKQLKIVRDHNMTDIQRINVELSKYEALLEQVKSDMILLTRERSALVKLNYDIDMKLGVIK